MSKVIRTRTRRLLAVTGAFALAASLLPGAALADNHEDGPEAPGSRGVDRVCPVEVPVPGAPSLSDVEGTTHEDAITCAVDYGFAQGFEDGTYGPDLAITRGQAAAIAAAMIEAAIGDDLPSPTESDFSDVPGTTHAVAIDKLAEAGVVQGREGGVFEPNDTITRGAMSRVIANAIDYADSGDVNDSLPAADDSEYFSDVVGSPFAADIQALAGVGIVQGRTTTTFEPASTVTRGQMAAFVMRGVDYLDREQRFAPTALGDVTFDVTLSGENELLVDEDTGEVLDIGVGADATAEAEIVVNAFEGTIDFELIFDEVEDTFDAEGTPGFHVHAGDIGTNGPVVFFLATGAEVQAAADDNDSVLTGQFLEADAMLGFRFADLLEDPDLFYLNLHSDTFVPGAVRGQFPTGGQNLLEAVEYRLDLTGEAEVAPFDGEDGATATAVIEVDPIAGTITHTTDFSNVTGPFDGEGTPGYHIHVGADDENGPVVEFLATAAELQAAADDDNSIITRVIENVDPLLLRLLIEEPENYYVNIHSDAEPGGAVRAQFDS